VAETQGIISFFNKLTFYCFVSEHLDWIEHLFGWVSLRNYDEFQILNWGQVLFQDSASKIFYGLELAVSWKKHQEQHSYRLSLSVHQTNIFHHLGSIWIIRVVSESLKSIFLPFKRKNQLEIIAY
jgi:hypothetical protein